MAEVVDLEKERQEKANTPEGKKAKKIQIFLGIVAAVIFFSVIYAITHNPNAPKDMVAITVQGVEIVPAKTKVQELLDSGFQLADQQVYNTIDLETKAEANSYYTMIQLVKEEKGYGTITIANDSNTPQKIAKCTVLKITVYDTHEGSENVLVDGAAMNELTYDDLVSKYGEPLGNEPGEYIGGTEFEWENKGYYFRTNVGDDGKLQFVQSVEGHH